MKRNKMTEEIVKMMSNLSNVRNIGLIGHIDHGKTTLSDSLLARAGLLNESIAGEARVLDFLEEEQKRGITMKSANVSLYYEVEDGQQEKDGGDTSNTHKYLINLVDTPGHLDFSGKVTRALRLIDGVIVIVDSVEEVSSQTETVMRQALREAVRPILFINKIDRLFNELKLDLVEIRQKFSRIIEDFNKLIYMYAPQEYKEIWNVDAEQGSVIFGSALDRWGFIIPQIIKNGHSMGYFKSKYNELEASAIHGRRSNKMGILHEIREYYPLWKSVLSMVVKLLPDPLSAQKYRIPYIWYGDQSSDLFKSINTCDANGPLVMCFSKVQKIDNRWVGTARIFSGTIDKKKRIFLINSQKKSYIKQLNIFMGSRLEHVDEIPAGNIVAIGGIEDLRSGETIVETSVSENFTPFESIKYVCEPVITISVEPDMLKNLEALEQSLEEIQIEDPNISITVSRDTGEVLVSGMGPLHLEIISKTIKDRGIEVNVSEPMSVFYESIRKKSAIHKGISSNQNNSIDISIERISKKNMEYFRNVEKRVIENEYYRIHSLKEQSDLQSEEIEGFWNIDNFHNILINLAKDQTYGNDPDIKYQIIKIIENICKAGPIVREPISELKIVIHNISIKEKDLEYIYSELASMISDAFKACMDDGKAIIIEPLYSLIITSPEEYVGNVSKLINKNQGQILKIRKNEYNTSIDATMSVRNSINFSKEIRNSTSGKVFWNSLFDSFKKIPPAERENIISDINFRKGFF